MRALLAAAMTAALLVPLPARADDGHLLSATCLAAGVAWERVVVATARADGHARVVSTEVVCTVQPVYGQPTTFRQAVAGPVAVTAGIVQNVPVRAPSVCVQATAYWSDGHFFATETVCDEDGWVSVEGAS